MVATLNPLKGRHVRSKKERAPKEPPTEIGADARGRVSNQRNKDGTTHSVINIEFAGCRSV